MSHVESSSKLGLRNVSFSEFTENISWTLPFSTVCESLVYWCIQAFFANFQICEYCVTMTPLSNTQQSLANLSMHWRNEIDTAKVKIWELGMHTAVYCCYHFGLLHFAGCCTETEVLSLPLVLCVLCLCTV